MEDAGWLIDPVPVPVPLLVMLPLVSRVCEVRMEKRLDTLVLDAAKRGFSTIST